MINITVCIILDGVKFGPSENRIHCYKLKESELDHAKVGPTELKSGISCYQHYTDGSIRSFVISYL